MRTRWMMGATLVAALGGCGDGPAGNAPGPAGGGTARALVKGETPARTVGAAAFLKDAKEFEGRFSIKGAVVSVDAATSRFLLCDLAEAGCIGAG